jgi:hypothetical protein
MEYVTITAADQRATTVTNETVAHPTQSVDAVAVATMTSVA